MRKTCISFLTVFAIATSAYASELANDGFEVSEGFTTGQLTTGWRGEAGNQGNWYGQFYTQTNVGSANFLVSSNQSRSGSQSVEIPKQGYYYNFLAYDFPEQSTGTVTFCWWLYLDSVDTANKNNTNGLLVNILDRFDPDDVAYSAASGTWSRGPGPRIYDYGTDYGGQVDSDTPNSYRMWTGESPAVQEILTTGIAAAGQWNGYQVVVDVDAGTHDFLANAGDTGWTQYFTGIAMYNQSGSPTLLDTWQGYQLSGSNYFHNDSTSVYLDDFLITVSPEPASLALLGLGGLALLRRRRV